MTPAGFATKSSPALAILSLGNRALTVLIHLQSSRAGNRLCFLAPPLLFRNRLSYLLSFQSIRVPVTEDLACSRTRHASHAKSREPPESQQSFPHFTDLARRRHRLQITFPPALPRLPAKHTTPSPRMFSLTEHTYDG